MQLENKKTKKPKVLLALSGGVDSSVAALLLKKQGYEVIGIFLKCFSDTKDPLTGECSYLNDKRTAQKMASFLQIPLLTLDLEKQYKSQIINPMINNYKKGLTPNPDISCNTIIKFPWLLKKAKSLNIDYIATGHYARIKKINNSYHLLTGKDKTKDQSYFLFELNQDILKHTFFPIGNLNKKEVRKIAKRNHFPNWNKQGTRGICFVGKVNMKSFLEKTIEQEKGIVLNPQGKIMGTHHGISFYTIGQKIGPHIGIEIDKPNQLAQKKWYVADKLKGNTIIAAPEGHKILKKSNIAIKKLYLINPKKISSNIKARIRHLGEMHKGKLVKKGKHYQFILSNSIEGITPGQYIVLYSNNKVIGGGEINQ